MLHADCRFSIRVILLLFSQRNSFSSSFSTSAFFNFSSAANSSQGGCVGCVDREGRPVNGVYGGCRLGK